MLEGQVVELVRHLERGIRANGDGLDNHQERQEDPDQYHDLVFS